MLGIATDAAFFPDGQHLIVRNYTQAAVYSWPDLAEVGRFGLPEQQQGEGHRRRRRRHDLRVFGGLARPRTADRAAGRRTPRDGAGGDAGAVGDGLAVARTNGQRDAAAGDPQGRELPEQPPEDRSTWGWALGGILGLGIVVVLARALRPR